MYNKLSNSLIGYWTLRLTGYKTNNFDYPPSGYNCLTPIVSALGHNFHPISPLLAIPRSNYLVAIKLLSEFYKALEVLSYSRCSGIQLPRLYCMSNDDRLDWLTLESFLLDTIRASWTRNANTLNTGRN